MPFSHHSHSGQFCLHAQDTLEQMIEAAIAKGMIVFSLTEHMPRDCVEDLYPEETAAHQTPFDLFRNFKDYYDAALRLRARYQHRIHLLVGFEVDYIRPSSIPLIRNLQSIYKFDFFVGSVHHVNTIPIDFDRQMYLRALESVGGTEDKLFEAYFDAQYEMLTRLRPAVVGHWDLIRLFSENPARPLVEYGPGVWNRVERNVNFVLSYRGLTELNSASFRKGWDEPYPRRDLAELVMAGGGRFTISDDSHCVSEVGLNYNRLLGYIRDIGLQEVYYLEKLPMGEMAINVLDACAVRSLTVDQLAQERFWEL
ncbi:polymerase/histidinol phosphatase-like protein [Tuber borchii]|uniref:Histidinol-phosphatase n=1 Tax=Tuber borchii TaxID=42251 RepID=A0A2T6ZEH0_TUBBO|nr:polymerase/histidinol phosphatase-like protein [Tuber borchii]